MFCSFTCPSWQEYRLSAQLTRASAEEANSATEMAAAARTRNRALEDMASVEDRSETDGNYSMRDIIYGGHKKRRTKRRNGAEACFKEWVTRSIFFFNFSHVSIIAYRLLNKIKKYSCWEMGRDFFNGASLLEKDALIISVS